MGDRPRSAVKDRPASSSLAPTDAFAPRHIGPDEAEIAQMLERLGTPSLDALIDDPASVRFHSLGEIVDELDVVAG